MMKKEYVIFTLTVLILVSLLLVGNSMQTGSPTGLTAAVRSISSSAPLVITIAFGLIAFVSFIAYKLTRE